MNVLFVLHGPAWGSHAAHATQIKGAYGCGTTQTVSYSTT